MKSTYKTFYTLFYDENISKVNYCASPFYKLI